MRRPRLLAGLAGLALTGGLLAGALPAGAAEPDAAPARTQAAAASYSWKNVRVDGGGFVPGLVFNRTEKNLLYARTDIGGAYRWDQAGSAWVPLLDHIGWDDWGHTGVVSLASDTADPDRVYAAVGTYTNDWDPGTGAVLRSADRGATWQRA
ncbi:xyloglucanase, partial [Streptomyces hydrogenans]